MTGKRVLVCGGRNFADEQAVFDWLSSFHKAHPIAVVIHGGAQGADSLAAEWARANAASEGIKTLCFKADWQTYRKAAGPIRNARMIAEGKPDCVIAFPGGVGTANMIKQAEAAGIQVYRAYA